ncbi:MAG: hypothetical protein GEU26_06500 [Nitrososphaeraceae archaeon]|nr:hypothetical protein [Nitrososphaeraceae archaeon]
MKQTIYVRMIYLNVLQTTRKIAIYVHGVWANEISAKEQVDRVRLGLEANKYPILLIGYSWDSNTSTNPMVGKLQRV